MGIQVHLRLHKSYARGLVTCLVQDLRLASEAAQLNPLNACHRDLLAWELSISFCSNAVCILIANGKAAKLFYHVILCV